jgi:hypothetical protein
MSDALKALPEHINQLRIRTAAVEKAGAGYLKFNGLYAQTCGQPYEGRRQGLPLLACPVSLDGVNMLETPLSIDLAKVDPKYLPTVTGAIAVSLEAQLLEQAQALHTHAAAILEAVQQLGVSEEQPKQAS